MDVPKGILVETNQIKGLPRRKWSSSQRAVREKP